MASSAQPAAHGPAPRTKARAASNENSVASSDVRPLIQSSAMSIPWKFRVQSALQASAAPRDSPSVVAKLQRTAAPASKNARFVSP